MRTEVELRRLRAKPRLKLFQPTTMRDPARDGGEPVKVHLLDLSAAGALVHAAVPPASGARIQIACGAQDRTASVMWADGKRFGIAFTVPLAEELVAAVIDDGQAVVTRPAVGIGPSNR